MDGTSEAVAGDSATLLNSPHLAPTDRALPIGSYLLPLARIVARQWPVLVVGAIAGSLLAGVIGTAPPRYTAQALVAVAQEQTVASFEPSITTTAPQTSVSGPAHRQAIADLIVNSAIEQDAIRRLATSLPSSRYGPGELIGDIQADPSTVSDVITVRATAGTQVEAVAIVNAWADSYVAFVNQLYLSQATQLDQLTADRDQAGQQLDKAQGALEDSLRGSRVEQLNDAIARDQDELKTLEAPTDAQQSSQGGYRSIQLQTLNSLADTLRRVELAQQSLKAIKVTRDASETTDSTTQAALSLLKAQLVVILNGLPPGMQLNVPVSTPPSGGEDIASLSAELTVLHDQVAQALATQRAAYEAAAAQRAQALDAELRQLRAEVELANSERTNLTARRDLALSTYTALAKKVEEQDIQQADLGREVTLASRANAATLVPQSVAVPRAVGAILGAILALGLALALRFAGTRLMPTRPTGYAQSHTTAG